MDNQQTTWWLTPHWKNFAHDHLEENQEYSPEGLPYYTVNEQGEKEWCKTWDIREAWPLIFTPGGFVVTIISLFIAWWLLPILSAVGCGLYADKKARHNKLNVRLVMVLLCALGAFMGTTAIKDSVAPAAEAPAAEQVAR